MVALGIYLLNVPAILTNTTLIAAITPPTSIVSLSNNLANFKKVFSYNSFGSSEALEQLVSFSAQVESSQTISSDLKQQFYDFGKQRVEIKVAETPRDARSKLGDGEVHVASPVFVIPSPPSRLQSSAAIGASHQLDIGTPHAASIARASAG